MKIKLLSLLLPALIIGCDRSTGTKSDGTETSAPQPIDKSADTGNVQQKDTLTIIDSDLATNPFDLGVNPLKKLTSIDNAGIEFKTYPNRHVDNQIDTIFQIKIEPDHFEVYKTVSKNWLTQAKVITDNFQTRHGVKVGMTKSEVKNQLNLTSAENLPDLVRLHNLEVPQWLDLKFKNERLESIEFIGYLD